MLSIKKGKQKRNALDLALVIGLTVQIKELARFMVPQLRLADLEFIESVERGKRRQAIKHIRETMSPRSLGIHVREPQSKAPNIGRKIAKLFKHGQRCPQCKKGILEKTYKDKQELTKCPKCRFWLKRGTFKFQPNKDITKYLSNLHKFQILSHWASLNDPNPIMYKTRK